MQPLSTKYNTASTSSRFSHLLRFPARGNNGSMITHWLSLKSLAYLRRLFSCIIRSLYHFSLIGTTSYEKCQIIAPPLQLQNKDNRPVRLVPDGHPTMGLQLFRVPLYWRDNRRIYYADYIAAYFTEDGQIYCAVFRFFDTFLLDFDRRTYFSLPFQYVSFYQFDLSSGDDSQDDKLQQLSTINTRG